MNNGSEGHITEKAKLVDPVVEVGKNEDKAILNDAAEPSEIIVVEFKLEHIDSANPEPIKQNCKPDNCIPEQEITCSSWTKVQ